MGYIFDCCRRRGIINPDPSYSLENHYGFVSGINFFVLLLTPFLENCREAPGRGLDTITCSNPGDSYKNQAVGFAVLLLAYPAYFIKL